MNNWLFLSLLSPAVYAVVNFIDKYLLSKSFPDYRALPFYTAIMGAFVGFFVWGYTRFNLLPGRDSAILLFVGVLTLFSLVAYFMALSREETSVVILLFQMVPVITLVLSYIFLGERITFTQLVGFIFIMTSAVLISKPKGREKFRLSRSFILILICDLIWAASAILMKYVLTVYTFSQVLAYESWGIAFGGLILWLFFRSYRAAFLKSVKNIRANTLGFLAVNELVYIVAKSLTFFAYTLGPVSLVSVLGTSQTFFGIAYGYILAFLAPKIFKGEREGLSIVYKFELAALLFVGVWLVY